ncbi:MAG: diaminopimelate decarboxylase [Idiomarina sp.]|mgnify:CR=1 FL=1|uniref:diaminopimelate decarboxylase n=1 Tax=Idiomarina sp. TaxID=1874361 RepID=UPI000C0DE9C9|nr:diaminopimelate decarboxylase [Idiomarina sp.]MAK70630.1 diaminopimelate decarboxylase [Idiomarinaceae bacterium]MBL4742478.1 diaminopimelate decarboxylase [Idiomarina sp.]MBT41330.1 diaminopimelate decarboxylase [Idiomarina sp.]PHQ76739.1 MAG: diaminopimelate decarboxylase [Idiomarina sp.]HAD47822.1 diaminopimelate decarboxylase [Idiomarina sp.]
MNYIDFKQGQLHVEQVPASQLAEQYGTPLYVYSKSQIIKNWQLFKQHWPKPHRLCYAVKANSNLAILQLLAEQGAGFDIVSAGELKRVLKAGGDPASVVFSGVAKSEDELRFALQQGIGCINVESAAELERIQQVAAELSQSAPVSLRVNPDVDAKTHPYIATGMKANKFGIAMADAMPIFKRAAALPNINLLGADCHIGSQIMSSEPFLDAAKRMFKLVEELASEGIKLSHLDLGGGFGISYEETDRLDLENYLKGVLELANNYPELTLMLEPGRAIVADAGILITRVEYIKATDDKRFALIDAGMNDLLRPSLYQAWHDIVAVQETQNARDQLVDVVGPVCETGCFLGHARHLTVKSGDLLAVKHAGAYGFTMSSNYNTRAKPAEVLIDQGSSYIIRERETFDDMVRGERLLKRT